MGISYTKEIKNTENTKNTKINEITYCIYECLEKNIKDLAQENQMLQNQLTYYKSLYYGRTKILDKNSEMSDE